MGDVLLPLALLYADNRSEIRGATRLQKLAFLAQQEHDVEQLHEFQPDRYGPFSPSLAKSVKTLERKGIVESEEQSVPGGNELLVYSLTEDGVRLVRTLLHERDEDVESTLEPVQQLKKDKNDLPLNRLLQYVYKKYPTYTSESELSLAEQV